MDDKFIRTKKQYEDRIRAWQADLRRTVFLDDVPSTSQAARGNRRQASRGRGRSINTRRPTPARSNAHTTPLANTRLLQHTLPERCATVRILTDRTMSVNKAECGEEKKATTAKVTPTPRGISSTNKGEQGPKIIRRLLTSSPCSSVGSIVEVSSTSTEEAPPRPKTTTRRVRPTNCPLENTGTQHQENTAYLWSIEEERTTKRMWGKYQAVRHTITINHLTPIKRGDSLKYLTNWEHRPQQKRVEPLLEYVGLESERSGRDSFTTKILPSPWDASSVSSAHTIVPSRGIAQISSGSTGSSPSMRPILCTPPRVQEKQVTSSAERPKRNNQAQYMAYTPSPPKRNKMPPSPVYKLREVTGHNQRPDMERMLTVNPPRVRVTRAQPPITWQTNQGNRPSAKHHTTQCEHRRRHTSNRRTTVAREETVIDYEPHIPRGVRETLTPVLTNERARTSLSERSRHIYEAHGREYRATFTRAGVVIVKEIRR